MGIRVFPILNSFCITSRLECVKVCTWSDSFNFKSSSKLNKAELAAQIQEAIVDSLVEKTTSAVEHYKPKSLLVSGGVAANKRLREKLQKSVKDKQIAIDLFIPDPKYCTDNGAVIAACAYFNNHAVSWKKVEANPELNIISK